MSNRAGFWHQPKTTDDSANRVQRTESTLSKQFQPNRERNGSTEWLDTQSRNSSSNHGFTPFKSVPQKKDGSMSKDAKTVADPFQYSPSAFTKEQPQSQSTPKVGSRPGSAVPRVPTIPRGERSQTWGRQQGNGLPPPHHYRSVSAMGHPAMGTLQRASSRASEIPQMQQMNARYNSYTTLPRPEQPLDVYGLNEQAYYGSHYYPGPQPKMIISRPPSAMHPPPMPTEYGHTMAPPPHPVPQKSPQLQMPPTAVAMNRSNPNATSSITSRRSELMSWNALSLLCSLQVLCALAIFGLGVFRMLQHAKWALGLELGYALSVLISGLIGISSVRSSSFCGAAFSYILAGVNCLISGAPFVLGLFPVVPYAFPQIDPRLLINKDEPFEIDLAMSLVVAISCLLSFVMMIFGCKALGNTCRAVQHLKHRADMDTSFTVEPLPIKQ